MTERPNRALIVDDYSPPPETLPPAVDTTNLPEAFLAQLTAAVRNIYILCGRAFRDDPDYGANGLTQYDGGGGVDRWGRAIPRVAIWPRVAAVIATLGADPFVFIRAQFHYAARGSIPPPQTMLGEHAAAHYAAYQNSPELDLTSQWERDHTSMMTTVIPLVLSLRWEEPRAYRQALLDLTTVHSSPLFRVCVAAERGFPDVAAFFRSRATLQYVFRRDAYIATWGEKIPSDVRSEGDSLRRSLLGLP